MKAFIDMQRHNYLTAIDHDFRDWTHQFMLMQVIRIEPLNEAFTRWQATCLKRDQLHLEDPETFVQTIDTTPGKPEWLVAA